MPVRVFLRIRNQPHYQYLQGCRRTLERNQIRSSCQCHRQTDAESHYGAVLGIVRSVAFYCYWLRRGGNTAAAAQDNANITLPNPKCNLLSDFFAFLSFSFFSGVTTASAKAFLIA